MNVNQKCARAIAAVLGVHAGAAGYAAAAVGTAEVYGQNLTNIIESVFTSSAQFVPAETITRPRVLGFKFGYKF